MPQSKNQTQFNARHATCNGHNNTETAEYRPFFLVVVDLNPGEKGKKSEDLRLDLQGDVEGRGYVVDTERYTCPGPEHHHGWLETGSIVAAVVYDNLRY